VHQAYPEGRGWCAPQRRGMPVRVRRGMGDARRVLVHVRVRMPDLTMAVRVGMKVPTLPSHEQSNRQNRGHHANQEFGAARQRLRYLRPEQD
jgi:hypothetical protein